jgi:hypothetical protein
MHVPELFATRPSFVSGTTLADAMSASKSAIVAG